MQILSQTMSILLVQNTFEYQTWNETDFQH